MLFYSLLSEECPSSTAILLSIDDYLLAADNQKSGLSNDSDRLLHRFGEAGVRIEKTGVEDLGINLLKHCILMAETDPGEVIRTFEQEFS
jgi:hypothetical protein